MALSGWWETALVSVPAHQIYFILYETYCVHTHSPIYRNTHNRTVQNSWIIICVRGNTLPTKSFWEAPEKRRRSRNGEIEKEKINIHALRVGKKDGGVKVWELCDGKSVIGIGIEWMSVLNASRVLKMIVRKSCIFIKTEAKTYRVSVCLCCIRKMKSEQWERTGSIKRIKVYIQTTANNKRITLSSFNESKSFRPSIYRWDTGIGFHFIFGAVCVSHKNR